MMQMLTDEEVNDGADATDEEVNDDADAFNEDTNCGLYVPALVYRQR